MASEKAMRDLSRLECNRRGWHFELTSYYDIKKRRNFDLFGILDAIAFTEDRVIGLQYTSAQHTSERAAKIQASDIWPHLRRVGWTVLVWGWHDDGRLKEVRVE